LNLLLAATAANLSLWLRNASACLHAILARLRSLLGLSPSFAYKRPAEDLVDGRQE